MNGIIIEHIRGGMDITKNGNLHPIEILIDK
jgi:hypothetical protein